MSGTHDADDYVRLYLQHHWIAARGGLDLFRRAAKSFGLESARGRFGELAEQVAQDRESLRGIMRRVGAREAGLLQNVAALGERLGRLKTNGTLLRRSPLSDLMEVEAMATAVEAKKCGWITMRELADSDDRLDAAELDRLLTRADAQRAALEEIRTLVLPRLAAQKS